MRTVAQILWRVMLVAGTVLLVSLLVAALSGEANALTNHPHKIRHRDTRAFPPSKAKMLAQNAAIDEMGLHRYRDDADVQDAVTRGELVPIDTATLDPRLPMNRRYLRPAANDFLSSLSVDFALRFGHAFVVTSAVRTIATQRSLRRWNHNAAPVKGPFASSHLAGTTFDIGRKRFTREENLWMGQYLYDVGDAVIVEEENGQACWHIFYRG